MCTYMDIRSYSRVAPHSPQTARLFLSLSLYSILTLIPALSLSEGEGAQGVHRVCKRDIALHSLNSFHTQPSR